MEEVKLEIKQNLNYYLKKSEKSQKNLVEFLDSDKGTVSGWFTGDVLPKILILPKICRFLDISISDLFGRFSNDKSLTDSEKFLLHDFRELSEEGQEEAQKYTSLLRLRYKKDSQPGVLQKEA